MLKVQVWDGDTITCELQNDTVAHRVWGMLEAEMDRQGCAELEKENKVMRELLDTYMEKLQQVGAQLEAYHEVCRKLEKQVSHVKCEACGYWVDPAAQRDGVYGQCMKDIPVVETHSHSNCQDFQSRYAYNSK